MMLRRKAGLTSALFSISHLFRIFMAYTRSVFFIFTTATCRRRGTLSLLRRIKNAFWVKIQQIRLKTDFMASVEHKLVPYRISRCGNRTKEDFLILVMKIHHLYAKFTVLNHKIDKLRDPFMSKVKIISWNQ